MRRVFVDDQREERPDEKPVYIDAYFCKSRFRHKHAEDSHSQEIVALKSGDEDAIESFVEEVAGWLCEGIAVAVVPGHDPRKQNSGIRQVAQRVAIKNSLHDLTIAVQRRVRIQPLHRRGSNDPEHLRASLAVPTPLLVKGQTIVLLDDVTTSGNSLAVCRDLLLENGAARVKMMALGKTWTPPRYRR